MGTLRTALFFDSMFAHPKPKHWQIHHLPTLRELSRDVPEIKLALFAARHFMHDHLIGTLHLLKVMTLMTVLSAWLLAALLPQALGWTHKAIGGGRQTAIMAIFGLLPFERFDPLLQVVNG
jgi:hypothetical protein